MFRHLVELVRDEALGSERCVVGLPYSFLSFS